MQKRGAVLSSANASYLISVSGSDIKTLLNEIQKLSSYADGSEITKDMIDRLAVKCLQSKIYDLSNAVVRGNYEKAYSVLDSLFAAKEDPIKVLSAISGCFVDMYRVKCAKRPVCRLMMFQIISVTAGVSSHSKTHLGTAHRSLFSVKKVNRCYNER